MATHTAGAERPGRPRRRIPLALGLVAGLAAACAPFDGDRAASSLYRHTGTTRNPSLQMLENTVEFAVVPAARALVQAPAALLVLERNLDGVLEQRIVLPNATATPGDNILHMRAQTQASARAHEFSFDEVRTRFGGIPAPFQNADPGGLLSGSDSLGSFVYARRDLGTDTVCVLVMRRIGSQARPLPRGTSSLDLVMRNCVIGTVEQALAPMNDRALAVAGVAEGAARTLSPFAAPTR